ncbi:hypothetical protein OBBRIDRAFT_780796 [Obba rivulosa]|uniref:Methyltransferase domain-containing protein n=1 Tax=Obba rivulosa TaxID=1052685 RepID=A0A8E2ARL8_9APHY|nr:hypothetical protein OBBRIDRAFT_780796 [Obba rivulosa]
MAQVSSSPVPDAGTRPSEKDFDLLRLHTGIEDEKDLMKHIVTIQEEAYKIFPYPCIRLFSFFWAKIARSPSYAKLLELGREREGAIFLDVGCSFGIDVRVAISDGFPSENIVATDLRPEFWDLGMNLFMSAPETFSVPFVCGDLFDLTFVKPCPPFYQRPDTHQPDLRKLASLNPLLGHVSVLYAGLLFHLFDEEEQLQLARILAGLLSPEPGSLIFGSHTAKSQQGTDTPRWPAGITNPFCHSPESWKELWEGQVFTKGTVKVEATLWPIDGILAQFGMEAKESERVYGMAWSVTRL